MLTHYIYIYIYCTNYTAITPHHHRPPHLDTASIRGGLHTTAKPGTPHSMSLAPSCQPDTFTTTDSHAQTSSNRWRFAHHCTTWYASLHEPCDLMPSGHLHHHRPQRPDLFRSPGAYPLLSPGYFTTHASYSVRWAVLRLMRIFKISICSNR